MAVLDNLVTLLRRWDVWKRIEETPDRIGALERRIDQLESALEKCPAEGCPFCGERAFRLEVSDAARLGSHREIWECEACGKRRETFVSHDVADPWMERKK